MRVLIVEDEERLAENIAAALREGPGYAVDTAADGETGAYLAERGEYDLILLDLMLPNVSGPDVLRRLRKKGQQAPVLVLTAITSKASVVELLNSGADDYVGKPFDLGELMARVKALIRRGKGVSHPLIRVGDLEVDTVERCVRCAGVEVELSPTEYRIVEYLSHRPSVIVSKESLLEHLYDFNWERHSNVIEAHVSNLRRKLNRGGEERWIETLRGRGYRLTSTLREIEP